MFRLDFVASNSRITYLTNGQTGETFCYKPFVCDQIDTGSPEFKLIAELFLGYPINNGNDTASARLVYGLGPLWLRARQDAQSVEFISSGIVGPDEDGRQELLGDFDQYLVELRQGNNNNNGPVQDSGSDTLSSLSFFFPAGRQARHFVDSIYWFTKGTDGQHKNAAIARVIGIDLSSVSEWIFKLPIGYGCVRDGQFDKELQLNVGLVLLHQGFPSQVLFDITTSRPNDELLYSWSSRRFSLSWLRYPLSRVDGNRNETENYYVTHVKERDQQTGKLVRTKRVWWAPSSKGQALIYEIDQTSGACSVGHKNVKDQLILDFPGNQNEDKPIVLSADQISFLFSDNSGYHLIDPGESYGEGKFLNAYYEKRVNNFELTADGTVVWQGPVSIIKQISSYSEYFDKRLNKKQVSRRFRKFKYLTLFEDYRTVLTIIFYSQQFDKLYYKAVIELLGNHGVDLEYVHKQLDVSSCFSADQQNNIVIKYPIEEPNLVKQLEDRQRTIKVHLFLNLFGQTQLSPLQITNFETSFDYFNMHLRMTLLNLPLTHTFAVQKSARLVGADSSSGRVDLVEMPASSVDKCAAHCEHYNCLRFSYHAQLRECRIELTRNDANVMGDPGSELYSYVNRSAIRATIWQSASYLSANELLDGPRPRLDSRSVIEMFQQMIEQDQTDATPSNNLAKVNTNPLVLRIQVDPDDGVESLASPNEVVMRPVSLGSDFESMNEYVKQIQIDTNDNLSTTDPLTELIKFGGQFAIEYNLLLEDREFNKDIGPGLDTSNQLTTSYEDCANYCENNDCRSFSYCSQNEECRITNYHYEKFIKKYSTESRSLSGCNIYTLDYLSKFENYGVTLAPTNVSKLVDGSSPRDCANWCMNEQSFKCQGFFYCKISAQAGSSSSDTFKCGLINKHVNRFPNEHKSLMLHGDEIRQAVNKQQQVCSFYSRSYLAQFDQFHGKKIDMYRDVETSLWQMFISGSDAENCAKLCIERTCLAFYVCAQREGPSVRQTCQLSLNQIKRSQLVEEKRCTTFVLSDKSHFNKKKLKLISEPADNDNDKRPDKEASIDQTQQRPPDVTLDQQQEEAMSMVNDISQPVLELLSATDSQDGSGRQMGGSNWLAKLFSLSFGLVLGVTLVVVWNEAYARGWLDKIRNRLQFGRA